MVMFTVVVEVTVLLAVGSVAWSVLMKRPVTSKDMALVHSADEAERLSENHWPQSGIFG